MRRIRTFGLSAGLALAGASLVLIAAVPGFESRASAGGPPTISADVATFGIGGQGVVSLQAQNMVAPGLGAWAINVVYDPAVLQLMSCGPVSGSVCNPNFAPDTIRVTGATAFGLLGNASLANVTFRCSTLGTSLLLVSVDTLADATPGGPRDISAAVSNGSVTCATTTPAPTSLPTAAAPTAAVTARGPSAGFGPGRADSDALIWIAAGLVGAGVAWLSAGLAGVALAAVGHSAARRRPQGFQPNMRPLTQRPPRGAEARPSSSKDYLPAFLPRRRPDRKR